MPSFRKMSWFTAAASLALAFMFSTVREGRAQIALGTAFTYQGSLTDGGVAANGDYDLTFALYDDSAAGSLLGTVTADDVAATRGVFTVALDFGAQFDGNRRWLEISVRPGADTGAYTTLSPRVELTAAPHAIYAIEAGHAATADNATTADSATTAADADLLDGMDSTEFALPSDIDWNLLANIPADFADNVDDVDDGDTTTTNELNTGLALSGTELQVVDAGGTLTVELSSLTALTFEQVLTAGMDAAGLDAVNLGMVGIGTDAPTDELTMEAGTFFQTSGDPEHVGSIGDSATTELDYAAYTAVAGRYAYVTGLLDDGLEVLDVSDPANPVHVAAVTDNGTTELDGANDIALAGRYLYVVARVDDGVEILDISDPAAPVHAGAITDGGAMELNGASGIVVAGRYAYVAAFDDDGLEILDVSDPTAPVHVGAISDDATTALNGAVDLAVEGRYAYIAAFAEDGVEIVDISDPANPVHVGAIFDDGTTALNGASGIAAAGRHVYVAGYSDDGVQILDVSDPANPTHAGAIFDDATTLLGGPNHIAVAGRYAYVAAFDDDALTVLDVSDPTNPTYVGAVADAAGRELNAPWGVTLAGRYAYVTGSADDGVEIVSIPGLDVPAANIGTVFSDSLHVAQSGDFGHEVLIRGGLNVGQAALVGGDLGVSGDAAFQGGIAAPNLGSGTGTPLVIDTSGNILEDSSSLRFKENVAPAALSPDAILRMEPRRYNHKGSSRTSIGYLAEELDALGLKDLVIYDDDGRPYSIAYDRIPLYQNEAIKRQSAAIERHQAEIETLRSENSELRDRLSRIESAVGGR